MVGAKNAWTLQYHVCLQSPLSSGHIGKHQETSGNIGKHQETLPAPR